MIVVYKSHICFRDVGAVVVWSFGRREVFLRAVERFEQLGDGGLVGVLGRGEAGAVHAVVDVRVGPLVGGFDVLAEIGGEEVDLAVLLRQEVVELVVEHADDLGRFVVDDRLVLLVVEGRHGEAAVVIGVHGEVDLAEVGEFWVERVWGDFLAGDVVGFGGEAPAWG